MNTIMARTAAGAGPSPTTTLIAVSADSGCSGAATAAVAETWQGRWRRPGAARRLRSWRRRRTPGGLGLGRGARLGEHLPHRDAAGPGECGRVLELRGGHDDPARSQPHRDPDLAAGQRDGAPAAGRPDAGHRRLPHPRRRGQREDRVAERGPLRDGGEDAQRVGRAAFFIRIGTSQASAAPAAGNADSTVGHSRGVQVVDVGLQHPHRRRRRRRHVRGADDHADDVGPSRRAVWARRPPAPAWGSGARPRCRGWWCATAPRMSRAAEVLRPRAPSPPRSSPRPPSRTARRPSRAGSRSSP